MSRRATRPEGFLHWKALLGLGLTLAALGLVLSVPSLASAQEGGESGPPGSPIHPPIEVLDPQGRPVLESGGPLSTMQTCGACHDTEFIAGHSFHVSAGMEQLAGGEASTLHEWDLGTGLFGRWDPLTYRYLSQQGDAVLDLTTAEWIMTIGARHVGGGPAQGSPSGASLLDLAPSLDSPETSILDPESGQPREWDWAESGVVEMNCFLCHTAAPNNQARMEALNAGQFAWANAATLEGTGVIVHQQSGWEWQPQAFDEDGLLNPESLVVQDPTNSNCGLCHGLVEDELEEPLVFFGCRPEASRTITTGQIISPERMADTGMNLIEKESLSRAWDVHAERLVECTDCHHSTNNPVYFRGSDDQRPEHLVFDPRRLELGEYLYQPSHDLARGAPGGSGVMRACQDCHSASASHEWLPFKDRHFEALRCETCHVDRIYATALQQYDWTVIDLEGNPATICRGLVGETGDPRSAIEGFQPILLPIDDGSGQVKLGPGNMISSWYWIYGDPARPVREIDLRAAWLDGADYGPEITETFDADGDGELDESELRIDSPRKQSLIADRLAALGLADPRIVGEVQAYPIHHTIAESDWALRECSVCHSTESRLSQDFTLAAYLPGGVEPQLLSDGSLALTGELVRDGQGGLVYRPDTGRDQRYVPGHNAVPWVDRLGVFSFLGVLMAVGAHSGLRFYSARKQTALPPETEDVYMYGFYERLWHWLQTTAIVLLLATGLMIHKPDVLGFVDFRLAVLVHNVLAAVLVLNAGLALFYHLASGEVRQYLPHPAGFFSQALEQARYYISGIFRGQPHPFEKRPSRKMNPLQQVTYLAILNVLLPLQVLTGILMWGVERWPGLANQIGGLSILAPFHTLIAWLFAAFIVAHVYLTTTGVRPLAGMRGMVMGWEEIETASDSMEAENDRSS